MKIKLTNIEGPEHIANKQKTVKSFLEADNLLENWRYYAPKDGSYHKIDFTIEDEGIEYKGRYDLERNDRTSLKQHVLDNLNYMANNYPKMKVECDEMKKYVVDNE